MLQYHFWENFPKWVPHQNVDEGYNIEKIGFQEEGLVRFFDFNHEIGPDEQLLLPRGITDFWGADTELPPFPDEQAFRRMCHALARESGGTGAEVDTDTAARNFYLAEIRRYDASVFLLQNIHYPYAAFARKDPSGGFAWISWPE